MADFLIVVATPPENVMDGFEGDILVTGPGIAATTYHLTKQLTKHRYRLVINLGICGSLDPAIRPGNLVQITGDQFSDFGAEDGDTFIDAFDIGLLNPNEFPFKDKILLPQAPHLEVLKNLPQCNGITVQTGNGSDRSVLEMARKYENRMESMEGAAVFYCCMMEGVPCIQVRAVSNMVERRDKSKWEIASALNNLRLFAVNLQKELLTIA